MRTFAQQQNRSETSPPLKANAALVPSRSNASEGELKLPGAPLDAATRAFAEPRFGADFSAVRVHTDDAAAHAARAVNAAAYTVHDHIILGQERYRPETQSGRKLLIHELTHVMQQRRNATPNREMGTQNDADEQQAQRVSHALSWGGLSDLYHSVAADVRPHSSPRLAPTLPVWSAAAAHIQRVQLTYDDGPDSAGNTRVVLDSLNAAGARATFYLVGKRIAQVENWRVVFDIAAAGHWLGNHAYDWNDRNDDHMFLHGTAEQRAEKILQTEWAIRDALMQGSADAKKTKKWDSISPTAQGYIEDVIAHGTGRFRTPGFQSKLWDPRLSDSTTGVTTRAALASVNEVLAASGLRPLAITEVSGLTGAREGVTVNPKDTDKGQTKEGITRGVKTGLDSNTDSILLHSRLGVTAAATPDIVADMKSRKFTFDSTAQGQLGSIQPKPGFAGLTTMSNPPKPGEIAAARAFLKQNMLTIGPVLSGSVALGILKLAQRAGTTEVKDFLAEIKSTMVATAAGPIPMANWLDANEQWRLFAGFIENWMTNQRFPRVKGVTF